MTPSVLSEKEQKLAIETKEKFLVALDDPVAQIHTFSSCIALSDLTRDGEFKLIIADLGKMDAASLAVNSPSSVKLKVYQGTSLKMENTILDFPTGVCSLFMDSNTPRVPVVAVASGQNVFLYKNMRPYFKYTLPQLPVSEIEQQYWSLAREGHLSPSDLRDRLEALRQNPEETIPLSTKSLKLIMMTNADVMANFVNLHRVSAITRHTVITCMTSIKKCQTEEDAVSCIVLGTENGDLFILEPETFTILSKFEIGVVPVFLDAAGEHDINYRITIVGRDAKLYNARKPQSWETPEVKLLAELSSQAVGLVRAGKMFMVGCMDQTLSCYTPKGKKVWSMTMPAAILATELMDQRSRGFQCMLVALDNCQIRMYREKFLVGILETTHKVSAMKFGQFGREEGALITVGEDGSLAVRLLRRVAKFSERELQAGAPEEQNVRLNIPKKTKLYIDQTVRERENSADIYRAFQQDLLKLKLSVAQSYKKALEKSLTPVAASEDAPIKLSAQVMGIGPMFKLMLGIQNTSPNKPVMDVMVTFRCDDSLYDVKKKLLQLGLLVPGLSYKYEVFVRCLTDQPISGDIEIFVFKATNCVPLVANVIQMPISEGSAI